MALFGHGSGRLFPIKERLVNLYLPPEVRGVPGLEAEEPSLWGVWLAEGWYGEVLGVVWDESPLLYARPGDDRAETPTGIFRLPPIKLMGVPDEK